MALSAQTYQGDGTTTDFALDFTLGYISTAHIHVFVDEEEIPQNTLQFVNAGGSVRLPTVPASGTKVLVRRIVPNDTLIHDYENGALLVEKNLDESNLQAVMLQHQAQDGFATDEGRQGNLNMGTYKLVNMGQGTEPTDGVTLEQAQEIAAQAAGSGVVPQVQPRQQGDGVTTTFSTPASTQQMPQSFFINLDGISQRPTTDYIINADGTVTFKDGSGNDEAPANNVDIDITLFEPVNSGDVNFDRSGAYTPEMFGASALALDNSESLEKMFNEASINRKNVLFDKLFQVTRQLDFVVEGFDGCPKLIGTDRFNTGILYNGPITDAVISFRTTSAVSRVLGLGTYQFLIDCNNLAATSIKNPSLVDPWFSDFAFIESNFVNATDVDLKFQGYLGCIKRNRFLGSANIGLEIQGPLTTGGNTSTIIEGNWATEGVKKGYKVENLVYSSFRNNSCDGQSVEIAYELSNFNGTFESNGAEQTQRYASFDKCVVDIVSPFPGFMGLVGGNVDNIIEIKGRTKATFSNFQEPDQWLKSGNTATTLIYIDPANQDGCDVTVVDGTVRPEHVYVEYANLSPSARNPRCINFPFLRDTFAHYGGGFASGGEVSAEFTGVDFQRFVRPYNPVSRNSLSFYTSAASTLKTLSNFDVAASNAGQQAAMYVVKVTGTRRYVNAGEVFSYQFNVTYANNVKSTSNTALIPCTAGVPCSVDINAAGNLELITIVTDTLWQVEITAVSAIGKMSSSATIGMTNPFIIDVQ
ncbi:tail fiber protein [Vibrio phage 526E57-1]